MGAVGEEDGVAGGFCAGEWVGWGESCEGGVEGEEVDGVVWDWVQGVLMDFL